VVSSKGLASDFLAVSSNTLNSDSLAALRVSTSDLGSDSTERRTLVVSSVSWNSDTLAALRDSSSFGLGSLVVSSEGLVSDSLNSDSLAALGISSFGLGSDSTE
jgi:hypothetical protein